MLTIELLNGLRSERRDRYRSLICESGKCDADGVELDAAVLGQLDSLATAQGLSAKEISEDLGASRSWHLHNAQRDEAEAAAPVAEKAVARGEADLATATVKRNELAQARPTTEQAAALRVSREEIASLSNNLKAARVPLARRERSTRALKELQAARPWLTGDK